MSVAGAAATAARAWTRFWFAEGPTLSLGVFRVLFGLVLLVEVTTNLNVQTNALEGRFHLPYLQAIHPLSLDTYQRLHGAQVAAAGLIALGVVPQLGCALYLVAEGRVFLADHLVFRNHTWLSLLLAALLLVSPCDRSLALLPFRRRGLASDARAPLTAQRLMQFQVSVMYFWSAVNKLAPGFLSGSVMAVAIGEEGLRRGLSGAILGALVGPEATERLAEWASRPEAMMAPAFATLCLELFLSFGLWWRRTRPLAILAGLAFHAVIGISMDIGTFGLLATSSYVLFLDPETLPRLRARMSSGAAPAPGAKEMP